ncbi:MAG: MBL fold metallo-hydrolase [Hamadaea sp.]|uniref:MBL fold metallo-hydrolase n=1 Tax=Hamadaea sp. TaxID=2024425 RepID=UPI0018360D12|nr:MBL fold metallo-hydrolase [Hamadaea sp.]NUR70782.1 MBL fold metallo-hydrolase [Hamadaea sp.]NUT24220.1 MBL fold metallo-hydrolase [Hamadaea sp.]
MALRVESRSVGPGDNNAYLLVCETTGEQLLIDAANEPRRLFELIGDGGLATIVTTHRHADHWQALAEVAAKTRARLLAHPLDADALPVPTSPVHDGDVIHVGEVALEVIHLAGHTPGSIALLHRGDPPQLFTGDSLFPGGPGRTTNPVEFGSLMDDLEAKVFGKLPDATIVWPGHGKPTTLGAERPSLPEWRARGW